MSSPLLMGDILYVVHAAYQASQVAEMTMHWQVTSTAGTGTNDLVAANELDTTIAPLITALMTVNATYYGTKVSIINRISNPIPQVYNLNAGPGAVGAQGLPMQVRGIVKLLTALAGKSGRGRMYVPFPDASDSAGTPPLPQAGYLTALSLLGSFLTQARTIGTVPNTAVLQPGVYNRKTKLFTPYNSFEAEAGWATQRRSGVFGAPNRIAPF